MILQGWHIDAFGVWRDHRVEDLAPGLNVFYGPNEIGKSTLHAFVRGALHGYPDARMKEPGHQPVGGGERSGRLFVVAPDGRRYGIERSGTRRLSIEDETGRQVGPEVLDAMLRGTDRQVFRDVFAFGLDELASLEGLDPEQLGLRIFDAGLGGAGPSVTDLVDELRSLQGAELRPRSGTIRELAAALRVARRDLDEAVRRNRGHGALAAAEARATAELAELRASLERSRATLREKELLLHLWPVEIRRRQALQARQAAPIDDVQAAAARLQALVAERRLYEERSEEVASLRAHIAADTSALDEAVQALGTDEARLRAMDRSDARRDAIEAHRRTIERARALLDERWREEERLEREAADLQAQAASFARSAGLPAGGILQQPEQPQWKTVGWILPAVAAAIFGLVAVVALLFAEPIAAGVAAAASIAAALWAVVHRQGGAGSEGHLHLDDLRARHAGALEALTLARQATEKAAAELEAAEAAWQQHAADLGAGLDCQAALARLQRADQLVDRLDALARSRSRLASLQAATRSWEAEAAALLRLVGIDEAPSLGLPLLQELLENERALLEATRQIDEQLGADAAARALRQELGRGEKATWEQAAQQARADIASLQADADAAQARLVEHRREREALEASADVPTCAAEVQRLEAELQEATRRWRQAALLEQVLHQTLERFQQERQPVVFRYASENFARITGGRWASIRQVADAHEVEVVNRQGRAVAPRDLSRGTVDQLYFSVRLGMVRAFAEQGRQLPLLLDDVLVNFDPVRADAAAEVIGSFSDQGQVLLFTCHPQTLERLVRVRPHCRVIDLEEERRRAAIVA